MICGSDPLSAISFLNLQQLGEMYIVYGFDFAPLLSTDCSIVKLRNLRVSQLHLLSSGSAPQVGAIAYKSGVL